MNTRKQLYLASEFDLLHSALLRIKERAQRVDEGESWDLPGYCISVVDGLTIPTEPTIIISSPPELEPLFELMRQSLLNQIRSNDTISLAIHNLTEIFKVADLSPPAA